MKAIVVTVFTIMDEAALTQKYFLRKDIICSFLATFLKQ